ncbi:MAG TPA: hypothetical protein VG713_20915, partial [Pirellulales bacterium]|nr:hypothetical protein [Pirellulales bacterium]
MIRATCAALLLVAVVGATDADAENATTDRVDHIIDVHTRSGEVRIAAVTTIGDGPLSQPRDTWLRSWFAWLDGNGDRELRGDELQHIPRPGSLRAIWRGDFDNFSAEFASDEELRAGTGLNDSLTEEMLVRYYNRADLFLPQLRAGDRETWDDRSTRWLFEALGNADHAITAISLATAPQKLAATDVDADERWSSAELKRALDTGARVAPDRAAASARFNVHGDELRAEATSVTRLATSIRLDTATEQPPMALAGAIMHLQSRRGMGTQAYEFGRDSLLQQFDGDDVNRDGALDDAEIQQSSLSAAFTSLHKLIARKPTKLLRLDDLEQLLSLHQQAASLLVVVTAQDRGRSLFSTLDANDDRLLTLREL